jgi:hypothetical protein
MHTLTGNDAATLILDDRQQGGDPAGYLTRHARGREPAISMEN